MRHSSSIHHHRYRFRCLTDYHKVLPTSSLRPAWMTDSHAPSTHKFSPSSVHACLTHSSSTPSVKVHTMSLKKTARRILNWVWDVTSHVQGLAHTTPAHVLGGGLLIAGHSFTVCSIVRPKSLLFSDLPLVVRVVLDSSHATGSLSLEAPQLTTST